MTEAAQTNTNPESSGLEMIEMPEHIRKLASGKLPKMVEKDNSPVSSNPFVNKQQEELTQVPKKPKVEKVIKQVETIEPDLIDLDINGQVVKYDLKNKDRIKADAQLAARATQKFQEAANMKNEAIGYVKPFLPGNDPVNSMKQLGWKQEDIESWMWNHLYKKVEVEGLSPEQKKIREYESKLQEIENSKNSDLQKLKDETFNKKFQKNDQELQKLIIDGYNTRKDIPKDEYTASRVLYYLKQAVLRDEPITINQVMDQVKGDFTNHNKFIIQSLDGDDLINALGEELAKKVNKAIVNKYKKSQSNSTKIEAEKQKKGIARTSEKYMNPNEWDEFIKNGRR